MGRKDFNLKAEKRNKKPEKGNKTDNLPQPDIVNQMAAEIIAGSQGKRDARESRFLLYYLVGYDVPTAGRMAGYAETTCHTNLYSKIRNSRQLREKVGEILSLLPEKYREWCKSRLLDVVEIDRKVLDRYLDDPELAIKHPRALRQIKEAAGVLDQERGSQQPPIRIGQIQIMVAGRARELEQGAEPRIPLPARIIDIPKENDEEPQTE